MKRVVLLFIMSIFVFSACGPNKNDELTTEQLVKEKERVKTLMKDYNKAFESESFSSIIETLSEDVVFFGSDSSEVIRSLSDYKNMIQKQWATTDIKYGEMVDPWILMDNKGTFASIIYGLPATVTMKDTIMHVFFRISRTLKKIDNSWKIASGVIGITQDMPKSTKEEKPAEQPVAPAK